MANLTDFFAQLSQRSEAKKTKKAEAKEATALETLRHVAYFIGCQYSGDYDSASELLDEAEEEELFPVDIINLCRRDRELMRQLNKGLQDGFEEDEDYDEDYEYDEEYGYEDDYDWDETDEDFDEEPAQLLEDRNSFGSNDFDDDEDFIFGMGHEDNAVDEDDEPARGEGRAYFNPLNF